MIIVGIKIINKFQSRHPQSKSGLEHWAKIIRQTDYKGYSDLQKAFPSADYVYSRYTIFNISGNSYRLITEISYPAQVVHVKIAWTHAEYDKKKNKHALKVGNI